jgi:diguanylate cyclase (GGDEF)-like protein
MLPSVPTAAFDFGTAAAALDALDRLTGDIRRELAQIRRDIAAAAVRYGDARCAQLQEANDHLVQAAMDAERRADEAAADLEEATRSSQFDLLTETPNRALMRDRLGEALAMARRHKIHLALLYLDLDGFKQVNDTAGHAAGDEVLKRTAARLHGAVRASDTVSRRGGDEFLVLLPEVANREAAARIAQKMLDAVAEPMELDGQTLRISASIGIALWPDDGDDAPALIGRADEAMYDAKHNGRNTYRFAGGASVVDAAHGRSLPPSPRETLLRDLRDVNEQLLLTALRAQELLDVAELARDRHSQSIAVLAHELRNPLAPIRTAGQWLMAVQAGDPRLRKAADMIDRQTAQLTRLIDDLLDSARASGAGFRLQPVKTRLRDVLERSIEASQAAMLSRRQILTARLPSPDVELEADPMRLEQVFSNLLDNASKYTPQEGCIELIAEDRGASVSVTVSDNGLGIAPQALPHIFDLFVQEPRTLGRDASGLGVGLAVVRELVLAHGGTVEARSAGPGLGSAFVVRLPRSATAAANLPAQTP